ncbi:Nn.00g080630.m01.CDS01 [Neocucurbitaria sp. VM-36]
MASEAGDVDTPPASDEPASANRNKHAALGGNEYVQKSAKMKWEALKATNEARQVMNEGSDRAHTVTLPDQKPERTMTEIYNAHFSTLTIEEKTRILLPLLLREDPMVVDAEFDRRPKTPKSTSPPQVKGKAASTATELEDHKEKQSKRKKWSTISVKTFSGKPDTGVIDPRIVSRGDPGTQFSSLASFGHALPPRDASGRARGVILECRNCGTVFSTETMELCPECGGASGLYNYATAARTTTGSRYGPEDAWSVSSGNDIPVQDSSDSSRGSESDASVIGGGGHGNLDENACANACDDKQPPFKTQEACYDPWATDHNPSYRREPDTETPAGASVWGPASDYTPSELNRSASGIRPGSVADTHETSIPKAKISISTGYTVTYWATIEAGDQTIHIPIDSTNVSGPEKTIVHGESSGMMKVWKWIQKKGLADKVGLQDAFDLAEDMYSEVEKTKDSREEDVEEEIQRAFGEWDLHSPSNPTHSVPKSQHGWCG